MSSSNRPGRSWRRLLALVAALLALLATACAGGNSGFPREPGQYPIQPNSLSYDGKSYELLWSDASGNLQPGTVETSTFLINIVDQGNGTLLITTTDKSTGASTSFQI